MIILTILTEKQEEGEPVLDFIKRVRNLTLRCPKRMLVSMLIQICWHNLLIKIESWMDVIKSHCWKEFIKQAKIIKKNTNFSSMNKLSKYVLEDGKDL